MKSSRRLFLCILLAWPAASAWARPSDEPIAPVPALGPGNHEIALGHGGRERRYVVHVPPRNDAGKPLPVVLCFHGAGSSGRGQQRYSRLDVTADREGFVTVYPDGTSRFGRLFTWNAGNCCGYAQLEKVDDVGFAMAVLDDVGRRLPIDPRRVYATGMSNGAMLSHRLACEAADRIAAVAPVAGALSVPECKPARPVPVLHFHSVDDPLALYGGGIGARIPDLLARVDQESVEQTIAVWAGLNGCPETPFVAPTIAASKDSRDKGQTATKITYGPCAGGAEVALFKLTGAGHVWPGGKPDKLHRILGRSTSLVNANEEMWAFFERFSLPDPASELASLMAGTYTSDEQAAADPEYRSIVLVMAPIWTERADGHWLYVEQAVKGKEDAPYRQRVYHVTARPDGSLESAVFSLPEPEKFVGAGGNARPLADLSPEKLLPRTGCTVILNETADGTYEGGTVGRECASELRGASSATSHVVITPDVLESWDRGFDAVGNQVWGATKGAYRFKKTASR